MPDSNSSPTGFEKIQAEVSEILTKARQGKANLFIKHNSYTRQFNVLYSYIKSQESK